MMDNPSSCRITISKSILRVCFYFPLKKKFDFKVWYLASFLTVHLEYLSLWVSFIFSFQFDSCISSFSFVPHLLTLYLLPKSSTSAAWSWGYLSPVSHPPTLQRLWQACRSSAPPCAVTVWAPEIVIHAPPPLSDTTSFPIAKVRAPIHFTAPPPPKSTHHPHHHLGCHPHLSLLDPLPFLIKTE